MLQQTILHVPTQFFPPARATEHLMGELVISKWTVHYGIFIDSSVKLSVLLSLIAFDQRKKNMYPQKKIILTQLERFPI